jgi:hypothetical protein
MFFVNGTQLALATGGAALKVPVRLRSLLARGIFCRRCSYSHIID